MYNLKTMFFSLFVYRFACSRKHRGEQRWAQRDRLGAVRQQDFLEQPVAVAFGAVPEAARRPVEPGRQTHHSRATLLAGGFSARVGLRARVSAGAASAEPRAAPTALGPT